MRLLVPCLYSCESSKNTFSNRTDPEVTCGVLKLIYTGVHTRCPVRHVLLKYIFWMSERLDRKLVMVVSPQTRSPSNRQIL